MQGRLLHSAPLEVSVFADDPVVRAGLLRALAEAPGRVLGRPADPAWLSGVDAVASHVVLWDLGFDPERGLKALREASPPVPVLALLEGRASLARAVAAGASGVLPRDVGPELLLAGLEALGQGLAVFDPSALSTLMAAAPPEAELVEELTAREREVLGLLAEGLSNKEIAARLDISEHTAKFHVNAIRGKFGVQRRLAAVVHAARLGLIDL